MNLSPQQEAILWLAYRNHRRYATSVLTLEQWTKTDTWFHRWKGRPTLYSWEVMVRVYGVQVSMRTARYVRRLNWHYWAGKNPKRESDVRHYRKYFDAGLFHVFRFHMSQEHKIYASAAEQRVASASMSRAVRTMAQRGLLVADRPMIHLTPLGAEIASTIERPALLANARQRIFVNTSHSRLANRSQRTIANNSLAKYQADTSLTAESA